MNALEATKPKQLTNGSFDQTQVDILRDTLFKGFDDSEMKFCLAVCNRTGLDPFARQVHFTKRKNHKTGKESITIVTGIDGFRALAQKSGAYAGAPDCAFEVNAKGLPTKATYTVQKIVQGMMVSFTSSVYWDEFYPGDTGDGFMWRKMPFQMLGKVAEAQALRKGFPAELGGIHADEEMHQANSTRAVIQTKAEKVTAQLDGKALPKEPEIMPAVFPPPASSPAESTPADVVNDVGDYVLKIGKQKGKALKECGLQDLQNFYTWGLKQENPNGQLVETLEVIQVYLESM
jgi:phage recombination protein Bet